MSTVADEGLGSSSFDAGDESPDTFLDGEERSSESMAMEGLEDCRSFICGDDLCETCALFGLLDPGPSLRAALLCCPRLGLLPLFAFLLFFLLFFFARTTTVFLASRPRPRPSRFSRVLLAPVCACECTEARESGQV